MAICSFESQEEEYVPSSRETSPPNARVAAMTSIRTNNFKTLRLNHSESTFETYETLVKHCLKHS